MKDILNELIKHFSNLVLEASELDNLDIKTETTQNGFIITAKTKPIKKEDNSELVKFVTDFKSYVKNTDECVFEKACQKYSERSDISLAELATISEEANLKNEKTIKTNCLLFKDCVKEAVVDFIVELQDKYEIFK